MAWELGSGVLGVRFKMAGFAWDLGVQGSGKTAAEAGQEQGQRAIPVGTLMPLGRGEANQFTCCRT